MQDFVSNPADAHCGPCQFAAGVRKTSLGNTQPPMVVGMVSTFADCSFHCNSSTSDSASLFTALVHLRSGTLDFGQSGCGEEQSPLPLCANDTRNRNKAKSLKPALSDSPLV